MKDKDDTAREIKALRRRGKERLRPKTVSPERLSSVEVEFSQGDGKYRLLAESAPLGIAIIGNDGQYKYLNPKFMAMFGYTLDDIPTGREWFAKAYPDAAYRRQVLSDWKLYLQEVQVGEAEPRTFTVTCKDGSDRVIKFRAIPMEGQEQFILYEDVTKLRHAEESRRETEELLQLLLESAGDAFFLHDHGKILEVNKQACESLGYSQEELLGMTVSDFEVGISPEKLVTLWEENLFHPCTLLGVQRRKDGSTFPVEVRANNFDYRGRKLRISLVRDITRRLRIEEAFKESELKYRALVENIPAITYMTSLDDFIPTTYISPQVESILGFTQADFKAEPNTWANHLHPEDRDWVLTEAAKCLETKKPFAAVYRMVTRDGRIVWLRDQAQVVEDSSGRSLFLQGVMLDITKWKQAEVALRESEERYRLIGENVRDVIWTTDLDFRISYASPSIKRLMGLDPEEIKGKLLGEVLPTESLGFSLGVLSEWMAREKGMNADLNRAMTLELKQYHRDGSVIWTEIRVSLIRDENHHPKGILGVTRDITERKKAEKALLRRDAILNAVSFAAEIFLKTHSWEPHIREVIGWLGQALDVSRVCILENHTDEGGNLLVSLRYEWTAANIEPLIGKPEFTGNSYSTLGLGRWRDKLPKGQIIWGHVTDFPSSERKLLEAQGIKSLIVVPIFVSQEWWGCICFGKIVHERDWSAMETDALQTAANILGLTILLHKEESALRESEEKMRSLGHQLLTAQEQERQSIAADLHDVLGHDLLLLKLKLESLQNELSPRDGLQKKKVRQIIHTLQESVRNLRSLTKELRPGNLEDLGLTTALYLLVQDFAEAKKILWQIDLDFLDNLFELPVKIAIYRMVQEALTNIGKHAKAKRITFRAKKDEQGVSFAIEDDGKGFNLPAVKKTKKTLGLLAMEERVNILRGSFQISSQKKQGTKISFRIPLSNGGNSN